MLKFSLLKKILRIVSSERKVLKSSSSGCRTRTFFGGGMREALLNEKEDGFQQLLRLRPWSLLLIKFSLSETLLF